MGMLGSRIAFLRKQAGLTQAALAQRLHISPAAIGMYEQGRREPPYDVLIDLSREFDVTLDYLLTGNAYAGQLSDSWEPKVFEVFSREELAVLMAAKLLGKSPE